MSELIKRLYAIKEASIEAQAKCDAQATAYEIECVIDCVDVLIRENKGLEALQQRNAELEAQVKQLKLEAGVAQMISFYESLTELSKKELSIFISENPGPVTSILEFLDPSLESEGSASNLINKEGE